MGLLSKKKAFCRFCGKEFTYRSKFLYDGMCDDIRNNRFYDENYKHVSRRAD